MIQLNLWPQSMDKYTITYLAIFPFKQIEQPGTSGNSVHREDFPSPLSLKDVPNPKYSAAAIHSGELPEYHAEPSVNWAQVFSSSIN